MHCLRAVGPGFSDSTVAQLRGHPRTVGVLDAFYGRRAADHVGRTLAEIAPDAAPLLEPPLRHVVDSGDAIDKLQFEMNHRSYVGTFFPVYDDHQTIRGLGGIIIDLTEQRRLEGELRAAVELRERVLAVVSHDLRNPLNTIELSMSTLPPICATDPEAARRVDIVKRATKMMENLIADVLDVATIQAGKLTLNLDEHDAGALVREVVELHAALAAEKHIHLADTAQLAGIAVRCDRTRMLQVLGNLVGNSIKFCKAGDRITVSGRALDGDVVLEVRDTGPGIPAADIPHLFEPYWSTARGRQRGTGLGLFISKAVVDAHHGSLTVESTPGAGTTFHVHLPMG